MTAAVRLVSPTPAGAAAAAAAAALPRTPPAGSSTQHPHVQRAVATRLLHIDPQALPPVPAPDAAAAARWLSGAQPPDLSPRGCPHLYYSQQQQQQQEQTDALGLAAELLRAGQPVAVPTETVYGLAADALSDAAVRAIFAAKGRPSDNPLIVHVSSLDQLAALYPPRRTSAAAQAQQQQSAQAQQQRAQAQQQAQQQAFDFLPAVYHRLVAAFWPGPLTLLLPASPLVSSVVTAGLPTMAVRMPAHPVARALIAAAGRPLAAPSANTSGRPSPTTAQHVLHDLGGVVAAIVDGGPCGHGVESTVLDGLRAPPVVLRPGGVTPEQLAACADMAGLQVYQRDFSDAALEHTPTTPGMKYRHYSPSAPLLLLDPAPGAQQAQPGREQLAALQQTVAAATQRLLAELGQQQRVVLLSTCSGSSSAACGWTAGSLAILQQQAQPCQQQQQVQPPQQAQQQQQLRMQVLEYVLGSWHEPELVARQLFAALRAADEAAPDVIVVQGLPPHGAGLAIMNRLHKAASRRVPVGVDAATQA